MPSAAPGLNVVNVTEAIAWYARVLGFSRGFVVPGEDPPYGLIHHEGLTLHLRKRPEAAGTSFCYLEVDDAQCWFDESAATGATFRRTIDRSSRGMLDFEVSDCCGNLIGVGQPTR
ncbi:MAG: VOC family protein [Planctomycetes bacterium]|jgi:uncharacterized glyoxalase superfamily protein PhnB|nr:VOC family protein [Planctomycetota bacterium]